MLNKQTNINDEFIASMSANIILIKHVTYQVILFYKSYSSSHERYISDLEELITCFFVMLDFYFFSILFFHQTFRFLRNVVIKHKFIIDVHLVYAQFMHFGSFDLVFML